MAQGIDAHAVLRDLEMEVRPRGVARGAGDADDLSLLHHVSHADLPAGEVGVEGGVAGAVGDDHVVAVGAGLLGDDHRPGLRGVDGAGVAHPADVRALVVGGADAAGGGPPAHGRGDVPAVHRPDVAAGVGVVVLPLGRHLLLQLLLHLLDLLLDAPLVGLDLIHRGLVLRLVVVDLLHQGDGLGPLVLQLALFL